MLFQRHKRKSLALMAFFGMLLGAGGGLLVGRAILLRAAVGSLSEYAADLDRYSMRYALEVGSVWKEFYPSPFAFCSDGEVAAMRGAIFGSLQVKDVGRSREGKIYCSGVVGRLDSPRTLQGGYLLLPNGARLYRDISLEISDSPEMMIEQKGVDVFFSSSAYDYWTRPHAHYAVFLTNPGSRQMMQIAGSKLEVDPGLLLGQEEWRSSGAIYRSVCNSADKVCAVAYEASHDIWMGARPLLWGFGGMGALAGFSLSLA